MLLLPFYGLVVAVAVQALSPSTVTLTTSANPVNFGRPLTLTAMVSAGATGKVTFYDGMSMLGVGSISGSTASMTTTLLQSGTRSLRAYYAGDTGFLSNTSASFSQNVVAGQSMGLRLPVNYPTTGTSAEAIAVGDFNGDLKQDVVVANYTSNNISVLLGNGDGTFKSAVKYAAGTGPDCVIVGDWNGDGKQDLAVSNYQSTVISIFLGNGDGTFQTATTVSVAGNVQALAAADLNGDGRADLAVAAYGNASNSIRILLGNGDGTFQAPVNYAAGNSGTYSVAVGDFNQDGKADLVFGGYLAVYVLVGNGDGSFKPAVTYNTGVYSYAVNVGDFNGDGKLDVATIDDNSYGSLKLLLGNGDGTLQPAIGNPVSTGSLALASADMNGDGILDAIYAANGSSTLGVVAGYGNGTFQSPVNYANSGYVYGIAIGDFNGDGKADVVSANYTNGYVSVFLGGAITDLTIALSHGVGFTQGQTGAYYKLVVSNTGDIISGGAVGVTDTLPSGFTATAISGTGWTCTLSTLTCTRSDSLAAGASYPPIIINVNVSSQAGSATDTATVSGGNDANSANNFATDTTNVRYTTSVSLASTPNPSTLGHLVILTATVGSGTGKVTFYDGATLLGVATVSGGQATLSTTQLAAGSHALTARYDGDSNYGPVFSATRTQVVNAVTANGMQPAVSYKVGNGPNSVVVGDFNGDGKADLLTGNQYDLSLLPGNGDGTFQAAKSIGSQNNVYIRAIAAGDINGDGKLDVAVAYDSSLVVLLGNGDGTFQSPLTVSSLTSYYSTAIVINDINHDGMADLILLNGNIFVYPGNGDGTFQAALTTTANVGSSGFWALSDMNNDGNLDVVFADGGYASLISVMRGNGDGTFQNPTTQNGIDNYVYGLITGDFNADGKSDVAELYWVGIGMLKGNGDGSLQSPSLSSISGNGGPPSNTAIAGDFNGDGKLDVAYRGYYNSSLIIIFGNGDGTFQTTSSVFPTDGYPGAVALADFNGDGRPDFVVANNSTGSINVFLGGQFSGLGITSSHTGRFTAGTTGSYQLTVSNPAFAPTSGAVSVTDTLPAGLTATAISGNGWNCVLATVTCTRSDTIGTGYSYPPITLNVNVAGSLSPSTITNQATVTYGGAGNTASDPTTIILNSTTSLTASPSPATLGQTVTLTATVTGTGTISGSVTFFDAGSFIGSSTIASGKAILTTRSLAAGVHALTATFSGDATHGSSRSSAQAVTVNAATSSGFGAQSLFATGAAPTMVASGDFNGDGNIDLATPNSTANTVSVLIGNGDGTFKSKVDYAVGKQPVALAVADLNGDGKQDLIVCNQNDNSLSALLGKGDGTFQSASTIQLTQPPISVAVSDFNQDSKLDLVVSFNYSNVAVMLGNGDGTFQSTVNYLNNYGYVAVPADFNGDGKPDVAVLYGSTIYVYLGIGDGTFQAPTYIYGRGSDPSLAVGDLNGDGKLDIVTTDNTGGVDVFLGRGDGTFQSYVYYASGTMPTSVAIADVNGDGKLDVLAANGGSNTVSVLLGKGDGTLQPQASYSTGSSPHGIAVGDFNGDGRTDVAVANQNSNNVSVLLGTLASVLQVSSTHPGNFLFNQTGAYTITVTNGGPGATSGTVTVVDTLPTGLTATAMSGSGWTCTLASLTCTQSASLGVGASFPIITLTVNVAGNAPSQVTNVVNVSASGAIPGTGTDVTNITVIPPPIPVSPANGQTGVSVGAALTWSAAAGATSYDVYFGTQSNPPLATNTTATSYTPGSLAANTIYYWRVVSKNAAGTASTATLTFMTGTTGLITISGQVTVSGIPLSGVVINVNGPSLVTATTVAGGSYSVSVAANNTYTVSASAMGYSFSSSITFPNLAANQTVNFTGIAMTGMEFYPVTPCRLVDTRVAGMPAGFGPPALLAGGTRTFTIPNNAACGIPSNAAAYSLNVTVVTKGYLGILTIWPAGQSQPNVSTLNSYSNTSTAVANAAIVPAGANGAINAWATDATELILDINGYFAPRGTGSLLFYTTTPCRVLDTRVGSFPAGFGPPSLAAGVTRTLTMPTGSPCEIPSSASAYSLNITAIPKSTLGFLTVWPAGKAQPNVSTLNVYTPGMVVANAAIVPAGTSGAINVYSTDTTDLVIDINGFFAPSADSRPGLRLYTVAPCRIADTRVSTFPTTLGPPAMNAGTQRSFTVPWGQCGIPSGAGAYSFNFTAVPHAPQLGIFTTWPTGVGMPNVSTMNSYSGSVVSNAAIVPAGTGGAVNVYVTDLSDVLFDVNGYFAP